MTTPATPAPSTPPAPAADGTLLTTPDAGAAAPPPAAAVPAGGQPASQPPPQSTAAGQNDGDATLLTGNEGEPAPDGEPKGQTPAPQKLTLKPPNGVKPDDKDFVKFLAFAEAKKLTQEQAQETLNLWHEQLGEAVKAIQAQAAAQRKQWEATAKADQEFGGEKLAESLTKAKAAMDKYGTPGLRQALGQSGLGNHPEVIRFFARIGRTLQAEDKFGRTGSEPPAKRTEQDVMKQRYPSMFPKEKEQ